MPAARSGTRTIRPWSARARTEDVAAARGGEAAADLRLDGVGERLVGRHEQGGGVRAVLGLGDEVGGDGHRVGVGVGEDEALRRAGGKVDPDLADDLDLGGGDPGGPGADDEVHGLEAVVREPVRERADRLDAARDEQRVDVEQPGGAEQDGVDAPFAIRGRRDDDHGRRRRPVPGRRP